MSCLLLASWQREGREREGVWHCRLSGVRHNSNSSSFNTSFAEVTAVLCCVVRPLICCLHSPQCPLIISFFNVECVLDYEYDEPTPIGNVSTSFKEACAIAQNQRN